MEMGVMLVWYVYVYVHFPRELWLTVAALLYGPRAEELFMIKSTDLLFNLSP